MLLRVLLDDSPADFDCSGLLTLGDLLQRTEENVPGRVVTGISADGEELDLAERPDWAGRRLEGLEPLAFQTAALPELVPEILEELQGHFPVLRETLERASEALRSGREGEAMEALGQVVVLWQVCLQVVGDATSALGVQLESVTVGAETLARRVERLRLAATPLEEALRRGDLVLVGDLCAYEMPPLVDQWEEAVQALRTLADPS